MSTKKPRPKGLRSGSLEELVHYSSGRDVTVHFDPSGRPTHITGSDTPPLSRVPLDDPYGFEEFVDVGEPSTDAELRAACAFASPSSVPMDIDPPMPEDDEDRDDDIDYKNLHPTERLARILESGE